MTGPSGNSEFCFLSTSMFPSAPPRGTLRVSGKQNSLFPLGPVIKCLLILNCPRTLAITCLSHQGQNSVHRTTFKVLPSRKQVCRSSKKNQLAVERRNCYGGSKTQQVKFTRSNFFTNKTSSNLILFTCFAKLATA